MDEPIWTMYCNVVEIEFHGCRVLLENSELEGLDSEMAYMRAYFERVVGSKDSETYYMLSPEGNNGPEVSIFFIRV
ncbi:hypothetical protein Bca101_009649 [Brassica carinata]